MTRARGRTRTDEWTARPNPLTARSHVVRLRVSKLRCLSLPLAAIQGSAKRWSAPRFGEFCSCSCCLLLLPQLACSITQPGVRLLAEHCTPSLSPHSARSALSEAVTLRRTSGHSGERAREGRLQIDRAVHNYEPRG